MINVSNAKSDVDKLLSEATADALPVTREDPSEQQTQGDEVEEIRQAAFARYVARQFAEGDPQQDWLEAEAEVAARRSQNKASD